MLTNQPQQFHDYLVEFLLLDGNKRTYTPRATGKLPALAIARRCLVSDGLSASQVQHEAIAEISR